MNQLLLNNIHDIVDDYVKKYIADIAEKFKLDKDILYGIWVDANIKKKSEPEKVGKSVKKYEIVKSVSDKVDKSDKKYETVKELEKVDKSNPTVKCEEKNSTTEVRKPKCKYRIQKGVNKGKFCPENASKGKEYCSRHKNFEGKKEKEIISKPQTDAVYEANRKKLPQPKKNSRTLVMNKKIKKFFHESTKFVFDENKERKIYQVVGKLVEGEIKPLQEKDVEECKKWSFYYSITQKNNVKKIEEDIESEEEDGEETECEEEEDGEETECEEEEDGEETECEEEEDGEETECEEEEDNMKSIADNNRHEVTEYKEDDEDIIDSESDDDSCCSLQLRGLDEDLIEEEEYFSEEY